MYGESKSGMQCAEFEGLLSDALDATLHGPTLAAFEAHQQSCPVCAAYVSRGLGRHALVEGTRGH